MSKKSFVGLDIGGSGIRAAEVKGKPGAHKIVRAASVDLPPGVIVDGQIVDQSALVSALKKLWKSGKFSSKKVAFAVIDNGVMIRQMELPWMEEKDFNESLRYQVDDDLPVDVSSVELDYHRLGTIERTDEMGQSSSVNRILLVAADRASITAEAKAIRKAGLEPVAVDAPAFALIRAACGGDIPSDSAVRAVVDLGAEQMTLVIHQAGQPVFIRTIASIGGSAATKAVADSLRMDTERAEALKISTGLNGPAPIIAPVVESAIFGASATPSAPQDPQAAATIQALGPWATAVVGEIRNSLEYFQASAGDAQLTDMTLVGRTVLLAGLRERIATEIGLPVLMMDPSIGLDTTKKLSKNSDSDSRLTVAVGLAMREAA